MFRRSFAITLSIVLSAGAIGMSGCESGNQSTSAVGEDASMSEEAELFGEETAPVGEDASMSEEAELFGEGSADD